MATNYQRTLRIVKHGFEIRIPFSMRDGWLRLDLLNRRTGELRCHFLEPDGNNLKLKKTSNFVVDLHKGSTHKSSRSKDSID